MKSGRLRAVQVETCEWALESGLSDVIHEGNQVGTKRELTDYLVEIMDPTEVGERHDAIVGALNDHHDPASDGTPHYEVTTNWTFPEDEPSTNLTGEPTPTDETGGYFQKLCDSEKGNQLQSMVDKIDQWGRNNRTVAQVFQVKDDLNAMFPPCLLDVQAFYRDGDVHLSAHFRSHTLAKSYYGDIRALGRLMAWLSEEVDAGVGSLVVHSGSIHIRKDNDEDELADELLHEVFR